MTERVRALAKKIEGYMLVYDWIGQRWQYHHFPIKNFTLDMKSDFQKTKWMNIKDLGLLEIRDVYGPDEYNDKDVYVVRAYLNDTYKISPAELLVAISDQ